MAKEKFLIIAEKMIPDCFGVFSETANCAAIDAGTADPSDPYSWIEASFEIKLVRYREATHICSLTPSAYYVWLQNQFVGEPNAAWDRDGDPEGLEFENGGECHGYGTYRDEYDPRFICETFTIDTMKDLPDPMRKPTVRNTLSHRTDKEQSALDRYHRAIWKAAEEAAREMMCNSLWCDILNVYTYRQWERDKLEATRRRSLDESKRAWMSL
ncbi:hypothetical protein KEU06_09425 [Pseudaminobacter sp. 19-2017]|uniref:Uncharacterized protein n=1 Tax=Pseudaminobacter soli (ex Zhang et al. 2022) TaxID=2831468 RepID=A0A942E1D8_9HYPH|nr:hypothetical protein [Pseudaminobacter soli]MBS3648825.1 hypothetical protein [Pseudaminobacter soli]